MVWRLLSQTILMILFLVINQVFINIISSLFSINSIYIPIDEGLANSNDLYIVITSLSAGLALVFSIWISGRLFDRRIFSEFGFKITNKWWVDFIFGLSLGGFLMLLIFLVELVAGWISIQELFVTRNPDAPFLGTILIPLVTFLFVGFYEELLSRGYHLTNLAEGFSSSLISPRAALIIATTLSSLVFGLLHTANPNASLISFLNISLAGIFLSTGYLLTGQLAIPIGLHFGWNFFQGNVFGFPVSGGDYRIATFIKVIQEGPALWTGGSFGPEGGLLGTIFSLLGILCILVWVRFRSGKTGLHLAISQPPSLHKQINIEPDPAMNFRSFPTIDKNLVNELKNYSHIIWDWNGTLLDDIQLCLDIINKLLAKRQLPTVTRDKYLDFFGFPVRDYYQKIGFNFEKESFETISTEFIKAYEQGRPLCHLMDGSYKIIKDLSEFGYSQSIVSASKQAYLIPAIEEYGLSSYFTAVNGIEDHHASGKLEMAKQYIRELNIPTDRILLIGDTLHDAEIADSMNLGCILIPNGHQSRQRLLSSGSTMVYSLDELNHYFQITWKNG